MAKPRRKNRKKGIFCLEGKWYGYKDKTTVEPVLRLLELTDGLKVPYLRHDVATHEEFNFHLRKWTGASLKTHPVLYLGFHGNPGEICIGEGKEALKLDELAEKLEGACKGRIIHFGSCSTLNVHGNRVNSFLRKTEALAVCGFKKDAYWFDSAAFELLLFGFLQDFPFTRRGIRKLDEFLKKMASGLQRELNFCICLPP